MPTYEYRCSSCGETFELVQSFSERETQQQLCPNCEASTVEQVPTTFYARTSRKS